MEIGVGFWQGEYDGITRRWLRWYDAHGEWIPTEGENERQQKIEAEKKAQAEARRAEDEALRAESERQQRKEAEKNAEQERSRADRLAARIRELGINSDEV